MTVVDLTGEPAKTPKPGDEDFIILTAFVVNDDGHGVPFHEQIGSHSTIDGAGDDRAESFLESLQREGELTSNTQYLVVRRHWIKSTYGEAGRVVLIVDATVWRIKSSFERVS